MCLNESLPLRLSGTLAYNSNISLKTTPASLTFVIVLMKKEALIVYHGYLLTSVNQDHSHSQQTCITCMNSIEAWGNLYEQHRSVGKAKFRE